MKRFMIAICTLFASAILATDESKPVAIMGAPSEVKAIARDILEKNGIKYEKLEKWLPPGEYSKYGVICLLESLRGLDVGNGWAEPDANKKVYDYISNGGIIVLSSSAISGLAGKPRDLSAISNILGFGYYENFISGTYTEEIFNDKEFLRQADLADEAYHWFSLNAVATKITTAKILCQYRSPGNEKTEAFLTVNQIGKGKVYWISAPYARIVGNIGILGDADANGNYVLTRNGREVEALNKLFSFLIGNGMKLTVNPPADKSSEWSIKPLGSPGTLDYQLIPMKQPRFSPVQTLVPTLQLSKNSVPTAKIVIPANPSTLQNHLAYEIKYHLDQITGGSFEIVPYSKDINLSGQNQSNVILLADETLAAAAGIENKDLKPETVIVKTRGNMVVIYGDVNVLSLATYYFLEKLGCRYLWPGNLGKVIPKAATLYAPAMNLGKAPEIAIRRIRTPGLTGSRSEAGMKNFGIPDYKEFPERHRVASLGTVGSENWFTWNGQGSREGVASGHAFGEYWSRFGKSHPEWFALQPDGTRDQSTSPDRSRFCKSNPELGKQIAADCIEYFKKNPKATSASLCLNDGGITNFCMCKSCREMDPGNAPSSNMLFFINSKAQRLPYVSLTDRMLEFSNRIAEQVLPEYPDKYFSFYAYSCYSTAPVKVKPNPKLLIFFAGGIYIDEKERASDFEDVKKWISFGNRFFWRSNALWGYNNYMVPQNYSRKFFNDMELMKANNLAGTDFDCMEYHWAFKGLVYYVLSKALWNPDNLDYDAIVDDYCRTGFGPASEEMKEYFAVLEKMSDTAAEKALKNPCEIFDDALISQLKSLLDSAQVKAAGDSAAIERINFIRIALNSGEICRKLYVAENSGDKKRYSELRKEYMDFIRKTAAENPLAMNPGISGFYDYYVGRK